MGLLQYSERARIKVKATTLDGFCEKVKLNVIHFPKVDVEGFEIEGLTGARRLIEKQAIRTLMFEVSQGPLQDLGSRQVQSATFLTTAVTVSTASR